MLTWITGSQTALRFERVSLAVSSVGRPRSDLSAESTALTDAFLPLLFPLVIQDAIGLP